MTRPLGVKATTGTDGAERCSQAFTVAAVAVASGVEVSLWLTGESAWFALPGPAAEFQLARRGPAPRPRRPGRGPAGHHGEGRHRGRTDRGRAGLRPGGDGGRDPGARLLERVV